VDEWASSLATNAKRSLVPRRALSMQFPDIESQIYVPLIPDMSKINSSYAVLCFHKYILHYVQELTTNSHNLAIKPDMH
jgi:hypothetical protein